MSRHPSPIVVAVCALALAACGGDDGAVRTAAVAAPEVTATATATPRPEPAAAHPGRRPAGTRLRTIDSQYGRIVGDGSGLAVYVFTKERGGRSECYGACAKAWPPVLAKGRPVAGRGIDEELLGTTRRRNGRRQLTYRGQPLYHYEHDQPGLVLCHDVVEFGGTWLVIRADGRPVR